MNKVIFIEDCDKLIMTKPINGGSCSKIYQYDENTYFKYLNEEYRDLNDSMNLELLELLEVLTNIRNSSHLILPKNIFRSKTILHGYTTSIVNADKLVNIPKKTKITDLEKALNDIKNDVKKLAMSKISTEDVTFDNILFDGNLHLLDFDLSSINRDENFDFLYLKTMFNVFDSILYIMIRGNADNPVFNDYKLGELYTKLHDLQSDEYQTFYQILIDILQNKTNSEITTIGQIRHSLRKTNVLL